MTAASMTVSGNVATEVRKEEKKNGDPWCHFRVACTERYYDDHTKQWVDAGTSYFTVICWQPNLARNVAVSLKVGDPVIVTGRGRVREWRDNQNVLRYSIEISANSVGHDLFRGTSTFVKPTRNGSTGPDGEEIKRAVVGYATGSEDADGVDKATGVVPPPPATGPGVLEDDPSGDDEAGDDDDHEDEDGKLVGASAAA